MSLRLETMSKIWKGNYVHFLTGTCQLFCLIFDLSQVVCTSSPAPLCLFWCAYPSSPKLIASLKGTLHLASWPAGFFIPKSVQKVWFGSSPLAVNHERGWRFGEVAIQLLKFGISQLLGQNKDVFLVFGLVFLAEEEKNRTVC